MDGAPRSERQSQRMWETDLTEPGRQLTLDELDGLEAMHQCQQLGELVTLTRQAVLHLASLEGRLDRIEQYLQRVDARYPRTPSPELAALAEARGA